MDSFFPTITTYLPLVPVLLAWLVGIVIALVNARKHPRVSLVAVLGLVLLLASSAAVIYLQAVLPVWLHTRYGMGFDQIGNILFLVQLVQAFLSVVAWVLLFWAIFGWRSPDRMNS